MTYVVQSVTLRRDKFSKGAAFDWIRSHGYKSDKVDVSPHFYRFRQVDPARLTAGRFRTVPLEDVGNLVLVYF